MLSRPFNKNCSAAAPAFYALILLVCLLSSLLPYASMQQQTAQYYVSLTGSDSNSGNSSAAAFLTIQKAATVITNLKNSATAAYTNTTYYVNIEGGRYYVTTNINIPTPTKNNNQYNGIVFRPTTRTSSVSITGGLNIPKSYWTLVTVDNNPTVYNVLPAEAKGKVYQVNLITQLGLTSGQIISFQRTGFYAGIKDSGTELFFKGKPMTLARYPNKNSADGSDQFLTISSTNGVNQFGFNSAAATGSIPASANTRNWPQEAAPFGFGFWY